MNWTSHIMNWVSLYIHNLYAALGSLVKYVLGFAKLSFVELVCVTDKDFGIADETDISEDKAK